MSTTPLWVPIVVAGIGVAGTLTAGIAGGLITQRWADRRDDKTWQRERLREQERWLRDVSVAVRKYPQVARLRSPVLAS